MVITNDISELEEKKKQHDDSTLELIKNAFLEPKKMKIEFLKSALEKQRNIPLDLLWNAQVSNKKIAHISYKEPYIAMANCTNKDDFNSMRGLWDYFGTFIYNKF